MNEATTFLTLITGLVLRIGIPVAITIGLIAVMRRLDARWQTSAEKEAGFIPMAPVHNSGCWEKHKCPPEKRSQCPAYLYQEIPCWQVHRSKSGVLTEQCIGCDIFRDAPIPMAA